MGLTAVILTKDLIGYVDLVLNRGLGGSAILQIAFFQVVPLLTLIFPLAVLMGVLVALGRLGSDLEILVLETLGIRATRLAGPIGLFSLAMALVCFWLSLVASPWASQALDAALINLSRINPAAQVRGGVISRFGDWQLEAREVTARGDSMKNVLLWMPSLGDTLFARSGSLIPTPSGGIKMILRDGRILLDSPKGPRHISFDELQTVLPGNNRPMLSGTRDRLQSASLGQLWDLAKEEAEAGVRYPSARIAAHRRFATPVTTLLFGLIAIPLFLTRKEYSRSAGGLLGLITIIAYFGMVQLGDGLIQDQWLNAEFGVWLPNIVVLIAGTWMFATIARQGVFGRDIDRQRGGGHAPNARNFLREFARKLQRLSGRARATLRSEKPLRSEPSESLILRPKRFALQRYVTAQLLQFLMLAFGILLAAYLLIDILDRLQWFAKHEATASEVMRFYGARIPVLAARIVPMSLLVAAALTASHLAAQGELIGMRACGIPAPKALLPVFLICLLMVPLYYVLNNEIMPRAAARQDEIKNQEIKSHRDQAQASNRRSPPAWYRVRNQLYQVGRLDGERGIAEDITFYDLADDGLPTRRTNATTARFIGGGVWRLLNPRSSELRDGGFHRIQAPTYAKLGDQLPAEVDTMHLSVEQLLAEIRSIEADDLDATALWVDYYGKLAAPFACLVLPAVVLFFAALGPPFPASATTLLLSGMLGVGYVLLSGTGASLGYGGALSPVAAGWGPTGLLTLLALFLALRFRLQGQPLSRRARN